MRYLFRCAIEGRTKKLSFCHSRECGNPARSATRMLCLMLILWIPAFAGMTSQARAQKTENLRHALDSLFSDTAFSNATSGVEIQSLKTGEYFYRRNEKKSLVPASNMKLFTTAEALATMGLDYQYRTMFVISPPDNHITVIGNGDPSFCATVEYGDSGRFNVLRTVIDSLHEMHIDSIGGLSVEGTMPAELYPDGWEIEDMWHDYAPEVQHLNFDENQVALFILPSDTIGATARLVFDSTNFGYCQAHLWPDLTKTTLKDSVPPLYISDDFLNNSIEVWGPVAYRKPVVERFAVHDAASFAAHAIRSLFNESGIHVGYSQTPQRKAFSDEDSDDGTRILYFKSHPLTALVRTMNKESDNLYAECLFRTAGIERANGYPEQGTTQIRRYLDSLGIDTTRLQFTDGSGLSRMDLVTPDAIVTLLRVMRSNPTFDSAFYNSLPIMGVDGTLEKRLKGTPAQGNVHAKTGSMTGVRSISGYLTTRDGEPVAFSILLNNYTCPGSDIGKLEDEVLLRLVGFSRQ